MDCDKCLWLLSTGKCVKALTNSECEFKRRFKRRCEVCDKEVGDFKYKGKLYCIDPGDLSDPGIEPTSVSCTDRWVLYH